MTILSLPPVTSAPIGARLAYAALFMVGLPVLLIWWAIELDAGLALPAYESRRAGGVLALSGLVLMVAAMRDLWVHGRGLPASPFPPERLVTTGTYRLLRDPIYVGAVAVAFGVSLLAGSAGGLWIVSPTLAMAATAFVLGFERDATTRRFGAASTPLIRMPCDTPERPEMRDRFSVYLLALLPWLVLYQAVESLGVPADALIARFDWENRLLVLPWTEAIYASTYLFVLSAPLIAKRARDLRTFAQGGLWATAVIIPVYLLLPLIAPARPVPGDGFWQGVMRWERAFDQPVTAFPAFHVVWTYLAAQLWTITYPRLRTVWWAVVAAVAVSCITTGMHAVVDVLAGLGAAVVLLQRQTLCRFVRAAAEKIANTWKELVIGPLRLVAHGGYAAAAAVVGGLISMHLAGRESTNWILAMTTAAILGAGLWGQLVEGSPRLSRPYGYFGSVVALVAVSVVAAVSGADGWLLFTAVGVGGTFAQAIGRLRCLTNGCCHGRASDGSLSIRYLHPRSRVVRLTTLAGTPLHPTPVYSAIWLLAVGAILVRLWILAAPLAFIAGVYFLLTGLGRFVEEHYRGEPQTVIIGGLRLYQWLATIVVVGGAVLTTLDTDPAPALEAIDLSSAPILLVVGAIAFLAYGVDFPRSNRRFSRLA
jgi:prolipoprotein diacylglyceryltransferase/protein-S-isoprenylcysteine O-methyltransferase Ste14